MCGQTCRVHNSWEFKPCCRQDIFLTMVRKQAPWTMVPTICVHDSHMKVWQFWLHQSSENIWGHFGNLFKIWAMTWQNQQSDCVPIEDSDQPGHLPSLIRVFAVRMKKTWVLSYPLSAQRRLWSEGWSESSLGAQSLCWFCHVVAHF